MRPPSICALLLPFIQGLGAAAYSTSLDLDHTRNHQRCIDISPHQEFLPGSAASFMVTFNVGQGIVSAVLFELGDEHLGGIRRPDSQEKEILCTMQNIQRKLCNASQLGEFLISDEARRLAAHPFVTRAVNLSSPISIHYPVENPGLYCTALYGFSASSFSAAMLAIDPHSSLPAFRTGLQAVYRYLGPTWIALSVSWVLSAAENRATLCSILPLSAVQVAIRWAGLQQDEQNGVSVGLRVAWYALEALQNSAVLVHNHRLANRREPRKAWLIAMLLVLYLVLSATTAWADMVATAESATTAYCNVLLGMLLGFYVAVDIFRLLRYYRATDQKLTSATARDSGTVAFVIALAIICGLFVGTALLNAWFIGQSLKPLEFGRAFWKSRYLTIDGPFEFIFLLWTLSLALHCGRQRHQQSTTGSATVEMYTISDGNDTIERLTDELDNDERDKLCN